MFGDTCFGGEMGSTGVSAMVVAEPPPIVTIEADDNDFIKIDGDEFEGEVAAVDASDVNSSDEADEFDGDGA